jgi:hypothetical protein
MARMVSLAAMVVSLAGCTSPVGAPTEADRSRDAILLQTAPPRDARERPVIVKLELRDADLIIEASPNGPRFAVAAEGGAVERNLGIAELAARYPALYQLYRSAVVRGSGPYLDARLDSRIPIEPKHRHGAR